MFYSFVSSLALAKKPSQEWNCTLISKEDKKSLNLNLKLTKTGITVKSEDFYTLKNETEFLKIKAEKLNYKFHTWYANAQVIGDYDGNESQKKSMNNHRAFLIYLAQSEAGDMEIYMHRLFYEENQIQTDDTKGICSLKSAP